MSSELVPITIIREFLGPSPSVFSGKKNPESSLVTSQLDLENELHVQIQCQLGFLMMLI